MESKKIGMIVCGSILILIICILFMRGCSIRRTETVDGTMGRVTTDEEYNDQSSGVNQNGTMMKSEQTGYDVPEEVLNGSTDSTLEVVGENNSEGYKDESVTTGIQESEAKENSDELSLKLVDSLSIVNKASADVLISSKNVYLVDDSVYAYALKLILPVENKGYKLVDYMCSVTTWNSVSSGDSIHVEYGLDEEGYIIILSLSKDTNSGN